MKHLKSFNSQDIIITIPKSIRWEDYCKEIDAVADGSQVMNFRVSNFPKTSIGSKCYILHDGFIKGYMFITGLASKDFTCTTTGREWKGNFIERSGKFHEIEPIAMKGFQGFRYFN